MAGLARIARRFGGMTITDATGRTVRHLPTPQGETAQASLRTRMARQGWVFVRERGGFMQFRKAGATLS